MCSSRTKTLAFGLRDRSVLRRHGVLDVPDPAREVPVLTGHRPQLMLMELIRGENNIK